MKLTWFGGNTFRLHYGGAILAVDPAGAPPHIDRAELVSGVDRVVDLHDSVLPAFEPERWQAPRARTALDADDTAEPVFVARLGENGLWLSEPSESAVALVWGEIDLAWGRWADGAVVVIAHPHGLVAGREALGAAAIRLVALALPEPDIDAALDIVRPGLGRAGLMVLEPGLALEI